MNEFKPISIPFHTIKTGSQASSEYNITITTTLKGDVAKQFEQMVEENNLNKSFLLKQMVYHCLGRIDLIEALQKSLLLWGK